MGARSLRVQTPRSALAFLPLGAWSTRSPQSVPLGVDILGIQFSTESLPLPAWVDLPYFKESQNLTGDNAPHTHTAFRDLCMLLEEISGASEIKGTRSWDSKAFGKFKINGVCV